jgi:diguanylate cyclase (GGDEF)-like protein
MANSTDEPADGGKASRDLLDALDALDEGFSLWDPDDRLVVCNRRYREIYPVSGARCEPGARFEDMVRYAVGNGEFNVPAARREDWIRERIRRHREPPDEPFEQLHASGRWILVAERRTPHGQTAGIRVDITSRKKMELALARLVAVGTTPGLDLDRRIHELLKLGTEHFRMPFAALTRAHEDTLTLRNVIAPDQSISAGSAIPLANTFCARAIRSGTTLEVLSEGDGSRDMHPFIERNAFRSYLGTPYLIDGQARGTVCFFSRETRRGGLPAGSKELLRLIAQWLGQELTRQAALDALAIARAEIERQATVDGLTGLLNRRALLDAGRCEFKRARRYGHEMSVLVLDLDFFKNVNESLGHEAGDQVLRDIAQCCKRCIRDADVIGRVGGEEFVVVLIQADSRHALDVGERIRQSVQSTDGGIGAMMTASVGAAQMVAADESFDALLGRADAALLSARERGRNQVRLAAG